MDKGYWKLKKREQRAKSGRRAEMAQRLRDYWARLKAEEPEKWALKMAAFSAGRRAAQERRREKALSGKQASRASDSCALPTEKEPEEPGSPARLLCYVTEIPINPRMVYARSAVSDRFEVIVGDSSRLWVDCPIWAEPSVSFVGYYEVVGDLPRGRWDRSYALRFEQ
jgi:hypothetical protein